MKNLFLGIFAAATLLAGVGCGNADNKGNESEPTNTTQTTGSTSAPSNLSGDIRVDGSSTVEPISQAVSEEFQKENSGVKVTVAASGTSGGFKKFLNGEIDICDASRPIDESEIKTAAEKGIEFLEIPVAFDGLTVVINPKNTFAETMTVEELKRAWEPNSKVTTWKDIRPEWPAEKIKFFGAGSESGTFDYFTEAIVGKKREQRKDYTGSENDNQLVMGVQGEQYSLGYFGYAYYSENSSKIKAVKVDAGKGAVEPTPETIMNGTYSPLSRPLLIYVNKKSMERPEVKAFVEYYLAQAPTLVEEVSYIPLPTAAYDLVKKHVADMKTGSKMQGSVVGMTIEELLKREQ